MIPKPRRIKTNSWEHYIFLLEKFNFKWRSSNHEKFIKYYLEQEALIEKLRNQFDQRNEVYNQYCPTPK